MKIHAAVIGGRESGLRIFGYLRRAPDGMQVAIGRDAP